MANRIIDKALAFLGNCTHVIESGESGGWHYKKWSDGTFEAWTYVVTSLAPYETNSLNGFYMYKYDFTLPFATKHNQYAVLTNWIVGSAHTLPSTILSKTTTTFTSYALSNNNGAATCGISVQVKGLWK